MGFDSAITLACDVDYDCLYGNQKMDQQKTEQRPWGTFTILEESEHFKVKKIEVKAGNRLSLQSHNEREEHWTIVQGNGVFSVSAPWEKDLTQIHVSAGQQLKIGKKTKHRIEALSDLVFVEVQIGICDEQDIIRYEDDYGRTEK